jgi:hypothetical protein
MGEREGLIAKQNPSLLSPVSSTGQALYERETMDCPSLVKRD